MTALISQSEQDQRRRGLRFVRRMHRMRMLGVVLTALPIAVFLSQHGAAPSLWIALALNVLAWPQVACWYGLRAQRPTAAERWSLVIDGAAGGFWVATMQLSVLPGVLLGSILLADRYAAGGWSLVRRAAPAFAGGLLVGLAVGGGAVDWRVSEPLMWACLPLLAVYPLALSVLSRRLTVKVAHQHRQLAALGPLDGKLDLPGRQRLNEQVADYLRIPSLDHQHAALMVLSLDQAAAVHSGYGPLAAGAIQTAMVEIVRDAARTSGIPARWDSHALGVLLPHIDQALATSLGELMRMRVRQIALQEHDELRCTASVGIAIWPGPWRGASDWLKGAEGAMQHARRLGGDCVYLAKPTPLQP